MIKLQLQLTLLCLFILNSVSSNSSDWPEFMGSKRNGFSSETNIFNEKNNPVLQAKWVKTLGSSYSGVSFHDNVAITMYSDHKFDYVKALEIKTGEQIWQYRIGPTYKGHGNSQDGPLSTPIIDDKQVYCLSPFGVLFSLEHNTGEVKWEIDLASQFQAIPPNWGFTTSPVLFENNIIVLAGIEDNGFVIALEKLTGEIKWKAEQDKVEYRSPTTGKLNNSNVLLTGGTELLYCLDPKTGQTKWKYPIEGGLTNTAMPVLVGENRILLQTQQEGLILLQVNQDSDQTKINTVWKNKKIKNTECLPSIQDGYVYCYSGRFLTCLSLTDGKTRWKSRAPGDGFLIGVDDHLIILTKRGKLHLAEANPSQYQEKSALQIFEDLAWTHPSFYQGQIYIRNYSQIACIDIVEESKSTNLQAYVKTQKTEFQQWLDLVQKSSETEKVKLIDEFMTNQKTFPIIESNNIVHFIYRGTAEDLALNADHTGIWDETSMNHVEESDFFYSTHKLEPDARIKYRYIKDLEEKILDPHNPQQVKESIVDEIESFSWFSMPEWKEENREFLVHKLAGKIENKKLESQIMSSDRKLTIYLPPDYHQSKDFYPVSYVHMGKLAREVGQIHLRVDQLVQEREIRPIILVMIDENPQGFYNEIFWNTESVDKYSLMLVKELVPFIDEHYRTIQESESRMNFGTSFSGYISLLTTIQHSNIFSRVSCQSSVYWAGEREKRIKDLIAQTSTKSIEIYMDWGRYDLKRKDMDVKGIRERNQQIYNQLRKKDYSVSGGEINAGFGWSSWVNQFDDILKLFYPYPI